MASMLDRPMLTFLRGLPEGSVASVCTGGLILAAAGVLGGRRAMTRSHPVGTEASAPLARLVFCSSVRPIAAAVCDDRGVVTSGGVSLAIDGTLYLIGCLYGREAQDEVARVIEYNRSFEANRAALGHAIARVSSHLDGALGHAHGMAADAHALEFAALDLQRQLDEARPSHLETLLDDTLVRPIG
jgi:transcriptional regulator GlxA family with amidase domain